MVSKIAHRDRRIKTRAIGPNSPPVRSNGQWLPVIFSVPTAAVHEIAPTGAVKRFRLCSDPHAVAARGDLDAVPAGLVGLESGRRGALGERPRVVRELEAQKAIVLTRRP